ncbi:MAG: hypothetical protein JW864_08170 [Spirochaetes bacterium]|nr:hypothetical protein [Spirochaetota bacterium]
MRKKKANTKFFYIKPVISIPMFFLLFNFYGHTAGSNYFPDISNPFHDVFYSYNNYNKSEAKKLLNRQYDKFFQNQIYINYGLILEYEENFSEAENYYRKALRNDKNLSITYLHNLYKKHNREKTLPLLFALKKNINSCWIDYEIAVHYAESNDEDKAIEYLSYAIDRGFSSADLLQKDNVFDSIRNRSGFKSLVRKAEKNYRKPDSIAEQMKAAEYEYEEDKPYGMINELRIAAYYENSGRDDKALNILSSLVRSKPAFRDKSIALFRLARINAGKGSRNDARLYLKSFVDHISGEEADDTGYKRLVKLIYKDLILNDRYLSNIGLDMIN